MGHPTKEMRGLLHNVNDLVSVSVGAVAGTATIEELDRRRIRHRDYAEVAAGLQALAAGKIDAFVYDRPLLAWRINRDFRGTVELLDVTFDSRYYAIALPSGSALRVPLDLAILESLQSVWWAETERRYLDAD